jgi:hypothetical protein
MFKRDRPIAASLGIHIVRLRPTFEDIGRGCPHICLPLNGETTDKRLRREGEKSTTPVVGENLSNREKRG